VFRTPRRALLLLTVRLDNFDHLGAPAARMVRMGGRLLRGLQNRFWRRFWRACRVHGSRGSRRACCGGGAGRRGRGLARWRWHRHVLLVRVLCAWVDDGRKDAQALSDACDAHTHTYIHTHTHTHKGYTSKVRRATTGTRSCCACFHSQRTSAPSFSLSRFVCLDCLCVYVSLCLCVSLSMCLCVSVSLCLYFCASSRPLQFQ